MLYPIWVQRTTYTTTSFGSALKTVACENCALEYVYLMEREGTGVGTTMYGLNDDGAADHAQAAANDTLASVLENGFDAVPCPQCGHYQRHMYPKLLASRWRGLRSLLLIVLFLACIDAVFTLHAIVTYLQFPNSQTAGRVATASAVLAMLGLTALAMTLVKRYQVRHFNPNLGDLQAQIQLGRSRAIGRRDYEQFQRNHHGFPESAEN